MKRKLFKQLWKILIRDHPETKKCGGRIVDTCSDNLMSALKESSRDKSICLADDVPYSTITGQGQFKDRTPRQMRDAATNAAKESMDRPAAPCSQFLPCPFCGSSNIEVMYDDGYNVGCRDCSTYVAPFLGGAADDKQKHIDFWNTRASMPSANVKNNRSPEDAANQKAT